LMTEMDALKVEDGYMKRDNEVLRRTIDSMRGVLHRLVGATVIFVGSVYRQDNNRRRNR